MGRFTETTAFVDLYVAAVPGEREIVVDPDEVHDAEWVTLETVEARLAPASRFSTTSRSSRGRGQGLGRALLAAVEDAARAAGVIGHELNVFGHNGAARSLCSTSGDEVVTQQMCKVI
ncbi:hypothetical protein GCM10009809_25580 [Isoptericola hypogeus]|uniref:N-acetyltransferase domain-containing protein n=1 Tax=Isoptericola hypogeus TaxID=300179 RepID=A0ABN2JIV4_9MICO